MRNGLNFTERGFGMRAAAGCNDRGHTAISQVKPGDFDWESIFGSSNGTRWFHTGGIFAALSASTADVAAEAMDAARSHGTPVSYDLNYRDSLWRSIGGKTKAQEVNRALVRKVDLLLGQRRRLFRHARRRNQGCDRRLRRTCPSPPTTTCFAKSQQRIRTSSSSPARCARRTPPAAMRGAQSRFIKDQIVHVPQQEIDILDRVGGGDSFASGLIYGILAGKPIDWAVRCGVAHGALAMTTAGDTSMATLAEVERAMKGGSARIAR